MRVGTCQPPAGVAEHFLERAAVEAAEERDALFDGQEARHVEQELRQVLQPREQRVAHAVAERAERLLGQDARAHVSVGER